MQRSWVQRPVTAGSTSGGGGNQASPQAGACPVLPTRRPRVQTALPLPPREDLLRFFDERTPMFEHVGARFPLPHSHRRAGKFTRLQGQEIIPFRSCATARANSAAQPAHGWFACLFDERSPYVERTSTRDSLFPTATVAPKTSHVSMGRKLSRFAHAPPARANSASTASAPLVCLPL